MSNRKWKKWIALVLSMSVFQVYGIGIATAMEETGQTEWIDSEILYEDIVSQQEETEEQYEEETIEWQETEVADMLETQSESICLEENQFAEYELDSVETEFISEEVLVSTETESEEFETDNRGIAVLKGKKGHVRLEAERMDGQLFEEGTIFQIRTLEEIAAEEENPSEANALFKEILHEPISQEILNRICKEWVFEIQLFHPDHSNFEDCNVKLRFMLPDSEFQDNVKSQIQEFQIVQMDDHRNMSFSTYDRIHTEYDSGKAETQITYTDAEGSLFLLFALSSEKNESTSFCSCKVESENPLRHDFKCERFLEELERLCTCDCEEIELFFHEPDCEAFLMAIREKCTCGANSDYLTEHEMDCSIIQYWEKLASQIGGMETYASITPSGTLITKAADYTKVTMGSRTFSSKYHQLRGVAGYSQYSSWCNSNTVLRGTNSNGRIEYFVPQSLNDKGKFGFKITKVGYNTEAKCYVDLLITVSDFNNYSLNSSGTKVKNIYPGIGMRTEGGIHFRFEDATAEFEMKCDIVKSGTNTKIPGNYRLCWTDIDGMQRFGLAMQDGTIDAKYALSTGTSYVQTKTVFNKSYQMLSGPSQSVSADPDDLNYSAVFELGNTSGFYILVGIAGNNTQSLYSSNSIKTQYNSLLDGGYENYSALDWSNWTYGPSDFALPEKLVSNDYVNWGKSNVLKSVKDEYWYRMEHYVPYEPSQYYYDNYTITDILPAGVDYAGGFKVYQLETGQEVTNRFTINNQDNLIITPSAGILNSADFYGYTYRFDFKVRFDDTELQPVYQGAELKYTVANTARFDIKHKTDAKITSLNSNSVTTTVASKKTQITKVSKAVSENGSEWKNELALNSEDDTFWYRLSVEIPVNTFGGFLSEFKLEDRLPEGVDYVGGFRVTDGKNDLTANFVLTEREDQISVVPIIGWLNNEKIYGTTIYAIFSVKMDTSEIEAVKENGNSRYIVENKFVLSAKQKGDGNSYSLSSNTVKTTAETKLVKILVTKKIKAEDIVWAHGNPSFTFCLTGRDEKGIMKKYHKLVSFDQNSTPNSGIVEKTIEFTVPSGKYELEEIPVIRYELKEIDGLVNGIVTDKKVSFDMIEKTEGAATFFNEKKNDAGTSHTDSIRNIIIPE